MVVNRVVSESFAAFAGRASKSVRCQGPAVRAARALALSATVLVALIGVLPASASAEATIGPEPTAGPIGLPDGRIYELVSPANKYGNFIRDEEFWGLASADGNSAAYMATSSFGEATEGSFSAYTSHRVPGQTASGWQTEAALPRSLHKFFIGEIAHWLVPSADFRKFAFATRMPFDKSQPLGPGGVSGVYLSETPFSEPTWLAEPKIAKPIPAEGGIEGGALFAIAGVAPDMSRVYFSYTGLLLPEDEARAPHVGTGGREASGFYEWSEGALHESGVLPDGSLNPYGAVPANSTNAVGFDNGVSEDGTRAFFVSPDPAVYSPGCASASCTASPPELYVRESGPGGSHRSVLISRSELPGHEGKPAPTGAVSVGTPQLQSVGGPVGSAGSYYVYATPDGKHAFFASADRLTTAAPENSELKEYDFNFETETLTYLPGVVGGIAAVDRSGSDFIFLNQSTNPAELELWQVGANGGKVTEIVSVPPNVEGGFSYVDVSSARVSADGSVFLFRTPSKIGPFRSGTVCSKSFGCEVQQPVEEVYRYDVPSAELTCVSCPPVGVAPTGDAAITHDNQEESEFGTTRESAGINYTPGSLYDSRGMSANGEQVFFDTTTPLVPQAVDGKRNVYEWEKGKVSLLSTGTSPADSTMLDSSVSGGDVFFVTASGLVPGDTEGNTDVYDARIPRPGDNPPPAAIPCEGAVCQGPPSVPNLLGSPSSATFNGLGNMTPTPEARVTTKVTKKKTKKRKGKKGRRGKRRGKKQKKKARSSRRHRFTSSNRRGK